MEESTLQRLAFSSTDFIHRFNFSDHAQNRNRLFLIFFAIGRASIFNNRDFVISIVSISGGSLDS
jgi:hypothetical protein